MQNIALVDAGVIFALLNRRDSFHGAVSDLFIQGEQLGVTLLTTWPVIAEVCSMLPERAQSAALDWVESTPTANEARSLVGQDVAVEVGGDYHVVSLIQEPHC